MVAASAVLWVGVPFGWLWVGSQVQAATDSLGVALLVMAAGVTASIAALLRLLGWLNLQYAHARERRGLESYGNVTLEGVMAISAGLGTSLVLHLVLPLLRVEPGPPQPWLLRTPPADRGHPPHHPDQRQPRAVRRRSTATCSGCGWSRPASTRTTRTRATSGSATPTAPPGTLVSLFEYPHMERGAVGVGSTHHFAFRVSSEDELEGWRRYLTSRGVPCTPVLDRERFKSLYLRDPDGHIVEIATDLPGFEPPAGP